MGNLTNLKEIEIEGQKVSPTFNLALWEYFYESEFRRYWELVEHKAKRLRKLREIDLFGLTDGEAKNKNRQIKYLEDELTKMAGIKDFAQNLKMAYLKTSVWLLNHFEQKEKEQLERIEIIESERQLLLNALENSCSWEGIYFQLIIECIEEAHSKGLTLECIKNTDLWG